MSQPYYPDSKGPPYPPGQDYPGGPAPPPVYGFPPAPQQGYPQPGYPQPGYSQPPMGGYQTSPPNAAPPPGYMPSAYAPPYNSNVHVDPEYGGDGLVGEPKDYSLSFTDKSIRQSFIRKVFAILSVQLAIVAGLIAAFVFQRDVKLWVRENSWAYFVSYVVFLVTYLAIACCPSVRRKSPANFILLGLMTLAMGYMTAMISSFHDTKLVFIGMGICAAVCASIILFSMNTKYDFTSWVGVMFVIFMVVFFFGIFAIIFRSQIMYAVYGGLMALIFMVFLAIDTQMLIGGKRVELDPEEYIFAATQLFLDIIYIFWFILQLLGALNNS